MKRIFATLAVIVASALLAACASPRTATLTNGSITNITSAEATTLAKQSNRTQRANDVMDKAPPIFQMKAIPGQKIEISGVESITVNVPIDQKLMMADDADVTSENVQMFDRAVRFGEKVVAPVAAAKLLIDDRKDARASSERITQINAETQRQENNTAAAQTSALLEAVTEKPPFYVLPAGATPAGQ